jgi:hypothetical protein
MKKQEDISDDQAKLVELTQIVEQKGRRHLFSSAFFKNDL